MKRRATRAALLAGVLAALVGGCGGDDDDEDLLSFNATRDCLGQAGVPVLTEPPDLYSIAEHASRGGLVAKLPTNQVAIAFERSVDEAERVESIARRFATSVEPTLRGYLERRENVVMHWRNIPGETGEAQIQNCLR